LKTVEMRIKVERALGQLMTVEDHTRMCCAIGNAVREGILGMIYTLNAELEGLTMAERGKVLEERFHDFLNDLADSSPNRGLEPVSPAPPAEPGA
jgi:hypothetical protein